MRETVPSSPPTGSLGYALHFSSADFHSVRCTFPPPLAATRLPDEFALLALRDALAVNKKLVSLPIVQQWIAQARGKGLFPAA